MKSSKEKSKYGCHSSSQAVGRTLFWQGILPSGFVGFSLGCKFVGFLHARLTCAHVGSVVSWVHPPCCNSVIFHDFIETMACLVGISA